MTGRANAGSESRVDESMIDESMIDESRINPSARSSAAIRSQTLGAGSSLAANCRASLAISFRSEARSEQSGQDFTCASMSVGNVPLEAPSRTSDRILSTSEHFIVTSPQYRNFRYPVLAFSALMNFRYSRSFNRALWSCDLLLPIEQPTS